MISLRAAYASHPFNADPMKLSVVKGYLLPRYPASTSRIYKDGDKWS